MYHIYIKFHKFFIPYVIVGILIFGLAAFQRGFGSLPMNLLNLGTVVKRIKLYNELIVNVI